MREIKISVTFKAEEFEFDKLQDNMPMFLKNIKEVLEDGIEFPSKLEIQYEGDKEV